MHYTGASVLVLRVAELMKSMAYAAHHFGTLPALGLLMTLTWCGCAGHFFVLQTGGKIHEAQGGTRPYQR